MQEDELGCRLCCICKLQIPALLFGSLQALFPLLERWPCQPDPVNSHPSVCSCNDKGSAHLRPEFFLTLGFRPLKVKSIAYFPVKRKTFYNFPSISPSHPCYVSQWSDWQSPLKLHSRSLFSSNSITLLPLTLSPLSQIRLYNNIIYIYSCL